MDAGNNGWRQWAGLGGVAHPPLRMNRCQGPAIAAVGTEVGMGHVQDDVVVIVRGTRGVITNDRP